MNDKFSAAEWKNSVEKDLTEIKKAIYEIYGFINTLEQWRRLPFNKEAQNANQDNSKGNTSKRKKGKSSKKLHRQSRKQNQRA